MATSGKRAKSLLLTPCPELTWPEVPQTITNKIVNDLKLALKSYGRSQQRLPFIRDKKERIEKRNEMKLANANETKDNTRKFLVMGLNAATRNVEKGNLEFLLVDRRVKPEIITNHLITLCTLRRCPVLCIFGLKTLSGILGVSSLSCLGFKRNCPDPAIMKLVEQLRNLVNLEENGETTILPAVCETKSENPEEKEDEEEKESDIKIEDTDKDITPKDQKFSNSNLLSKRSTSEGNSPTKSKKRKKNNKNK